MCLQSDGYFLKFILYTGSFLQEHAVKYIYSHLFYIHAAVTYSTLHVDDRSAAPCQEARAADAHVGLEADLVQTIEKLPGAAQLVYNRAQMPMHMHLSASVMSFEMCLYTLLW